MMQNVLTMIAQLISCVVILVISFIAIPVGNGWEVVMLTVLYTIEVCFVGWMMTRIFKTEFSFTPLKAGIVLIFAVLGASLLLIPGLIGLYVYFLPAAGAIIGYQFVTGQLGVAV